MLLSTQPVPNTCYMNVLGKNITDLARKRQLSIPKLAMRAGVDKGNLSKIIRSGEGYSSTSLGKLAEALSVTVDRLFAANQSAPALPEGVRKIPMLDEAGVVRLSLSAPYLQDAEMRDFVLTTNAKLSDSTFGLPVPDDSMAPDLNRGDTVIVDLKAEVFPGKFVVVVVDGKRSVIRRYADRGSDSEGNSVFELIPANPHYPTLSSDRHQLVITGVVRERNISLD